MVFGIRCFEIVHPTKHDFGDFPRPEIRFFGAPEPQSFGQNLTVLSRPGSRNPENPNPGQLGRAPAERVFMVWLPKSSRILRPLLQTDEKL